eukprot:6186721-Prymnesium_polylepis.1
MRARHPFTISLLVASVAAQCWEHKCDAYPNKSCDDLIGNYTCESLEADHGCNCGGCSCVPPTVAPT